MAGPWLYSIAQKAKRTFVLKDGIKLIVSVESYKELVQTGRLIEDAQWYIKQNWKYIEVGDEVFIYAGDGDIGIIGYATIQRVAEEKPHGWYVHLEFDLNRCRLLLAKPIHASIVRQWVHYPRKNVVNLERFENELHRLVPWNSGKRKRKVSVVDDEESFPEGREVYELHRARERNSRVIKVAKRKRIKADSLLRCEICGFSFVETYGQLGQGFIEAHHTIPVSQLSGEIETKVEDIALVCSNCHRMLHRHRPWLDMTGLEGLIKP